MKNLFLLLASIIILFNPIHLQSATYDNDTLDIFSKIIPRFVLMSNQKQSLQDNIDICILHDSYDEEVALTLIKKIQTNYPDGIKNYTITLSHSDYFHLQKCRKSELTFMFNSEERNIANSIDFLNRNAVITMSYDARYLEKGVATSLFLGRKVVPYINISALRQNGFEIDNALVHISKIYLQGDGK